MEMKLPMIKLGDDPFLIDHHSAKLRNSNEPFNEILIDKMEHTTLRSIDIRVCRFFYDSVNKCMADINGFEGNVPDTILYLEFPERIIRNPLDSDPYSLKARILPRVKIFGTAFIVDTLKLVLSELWDRENRISFEDLQVSGLEDKIFMDYNVQTRNIAGPEDDQDAIAIAFLPSMDELDPIAWDVMKAPSSQRAALTELFQFTWKELTQKPIRQRSDGKGLQRSRTPGR